MATLGTFIAGPYTAAYDGSDIGLLDPQGTGRAIEIICNELQYSITAHAYGRTPIDAIAQGGDYLISMIAEEQIAGALKAFWPHGLGTGFSQIAVHPTIGKLATNIGKNLVLTAIAGTTAATGGPATLTALVYPTEESKRIVMDTELRKFPINMRMLLQLYSTTYQFFTAT